MQKRSPAPCILSLVFGTRGLPLLIFLTNLCVRFPNENYGVVTNDGRLNPIWIIFFVIAFICMVVAVVLGIISIKQKRRLMGFAKAGIITGLIVFLLPLLFFGFLFLVFSV